MTLTKRGAFLFFTDEDLNGEQGPDSIHPAPRVTAPTAFVAVSRKQFSTDDLLWGDETPFDSRSAWLWLIQSAAWKDGEYHTAFRLDTLRRGEFVASLRYLADRWMWGKTTVSRYLAMLTQADRISEQRVGHHGTVYLIVNYDSYNAIGANRGTPLKSNTPKTGTLNGTLNGTPTFPSDAYKNSTPNTSSGNYGTLDGTLCGTQRGHNADKVEEGKEGKEELPTADLKNRHRKAATVKYPHFPTTTCDAGFEHWVATHGPIDYATYRKTLGPRFFGFATDPTPDQLVNAQTAHCEAVAEMTTKDAGFETIFRFAGRLTDWIRLGAMPFTDEWGVFTERGRVLGTKALREQRIA